MRIEEYLPPNESGSLKDTWLAFRKEHQCSIDRMLCSPALRSAFVAAAKAATKSDDEEAIRWGLMGLRKNKDLNAVS